MLSLHARIIVAMTTNEGGGERCIPGRMADCGASTTDLINQNSRSPQKMHVCKAGTVEMLQAETVLGGVALSVLIYIA